MGHTVSKAKEVQEVLSHPRHIRQVLRGPQDPNVRSSSTAQRGSSSSRSGGQAVDSRASSHSRQPERSASAARKERPSSATIHKIENPPSRGRDEKRPSSSLAQNTERSLSFTRGEIDKLHLSSDFEKPKRSSSSIRRAAQKKYTTSPLNTDMLKNASRSLSRVPSETYASNPEILATLKACEEPHESRLADFAGLTIESLAIRDIITATIHDYQQEDYNGKTDAQWTKTCVGYRMDINDEPYPLLFGLVKSWNSRHKVLKIEDVVAEAEQELVDVLKKSAFAVCSYLMVGQHLRMFRPLSSPDAKVARNSRTGTKVPILETLTNGVFWHIIHDADKISRQLKIIQEWDDALTETVDDIPRPEGQA